MDYFLLGVPSYRLRWKGLANPKSIERFFRLVRAALALHEECLAPFEGAIECDETTFGGRRKGKRGWGAAGKVIVLGILQRNGRVRVFPLDARQRHTVLPYLRSHTKPGSLYFTDDWHAYASLAVRGEHVVVRKEKGRPLGRDHINGIEGFWSYVRTDSTTTGESLKKSSTFTWLKFPTASTNGKATFTPRPSSSYKKPIFSKSKIFSPFCWGITIIKDSVEMERKKEKERLEEEAKVALNSALPNYPEPPRVKMRPFDMGDPAFYHGLSKEEVAQLLEITKPIFADLSPEAQELKMAISQFLRQAFADTLRNYGWSEEEKLRLEEFRKEAERLGLYQLTEEQMLERQKRYGESFRRKSKE